MTEEITLSEYLRLSSGLRRIEPLGMCCSNALLETAYVEPLAGKTVPQTARTCIVRCPECKKMYISKWD